MTNHVERGAEQMGASRHRGGGAEAVLRPPFFSLDCLLLAGCGLLVFLLLGPLLTMPLHLPLNYNEGWNAVFDMRAVTPDSPALYPPAGSFVFNNYPPLGFYIVGGLGRFVFGDMILAGRVVALVSLLSAAALTGSCVRQLGGSARGAWAAALLLLLFCGTFYRAYVAMDDPQWLAHAVMLGGLATLLRTRGAARLAAGDVRVGELACAALLMVAGGFIKHTLIALPLSVTFWLICLHRRAAWVWVAAAGLGLGAGMSVVAFWHGGAAFTAILQHRRVFRAALMVHAVNGLAPLLPMAIVGAVTFRAMWRAACAERRAALLLVVIFGIVATLTGVLQRLGEGINDNAHFETLIAACMGCGLGLAGAAEKLVRWRGMQAGPAALAIVAALPLLWDAPSRLPASWHDIVDRRLRAEAWRPVIARIAAADGAAACSQMSLCWWAGKPSEVDMFNLTELIEAGGDSGPFRAAVAAHRFAVFEHNPASSTRKNVPPGADRDLIANIFRSAGYRAVVRGPDDSAVLAPD